jgi:hypothetical protein
MAVAEADGMTAQAEAVAAAFRGALEAAQDAAIVALPPRDRFAV